MSLQEQLLHITEVEVTGQLAAATDPDMQGYLLRTYDPRQGNREHMPVNEYEALLDFAADPEASSSKYIRAYALDIGLRGLFIAEQKGQELTESQQETLAAARSILPVEYFSSAVQVALTEARGDGITPDDLKTYKGEHPLQSYVYAYHRFFGWLAKSEGVSSAVVAEPLYDDMWVQDAIPVSTGTLLQRMARCEPKQIGLIPPAMAHEALDMILDFRNPEFPAKAALFTETARLARFSAEAGLEHDAPIEFLHALPEQQRLEYARTFNNLYESAAGLREAFPSELGNKVTEAARSLLANAMFAIQTHMQQGHETHTTITLHNGAELPLNLSGDEPLQLLQQLDYAFRKLHTAVTSSTARSVLAIQGDGFQIHRFIDLATTNPATVSRYTRAFESHAYNDRFEYGRGGIGVEASMSYKVQLNDEHLLPLSKYVPAPDTISIRLDREHNDVISLDIGSVLGNEATFGTRIGRLLAWGNSLRAQAAGKEVSLNHVRDKLDQQYGQSQAFAEIACADTRRINAMGATPKELLIYTRDVVSRRAGCVMLTN